MLLYIFENLRHSVSQVNSSKTVELYKASRFNYVTAYKLGKICLLVWRIEQGTTDYWIAPKKLDADMVPSEPLFCSSTMLNINGYIQNSCGMVFINVNGELGFQAGAANAIWNAGTCMWIVKS